MPAVKKIALGKILLENKIINQEQLDAAITRHKSTGERLGSALIELGFLTEDKLLSVLSQQLHIPYVDLKNYSLEASVVSKLPEFYARRYRAIVLKSDEEGLLVGMADPLDLLASDELSRILNEPIKVGLVREEDLLKTIDMMYRRTTEISSLAEELSAELKSNDFDLDQLSVGLSSQDVPVMKLLQTVFDDAVQVNASDIHIEPDEHVLRIRQRIDGVLHEQIMKEKNVASAMALRLKLMAGLNIAEKRLPQDGRFTIKIKNFNFDIRLSTLPVQFGESIVLRLLNQSADVLSLKQIGMPEAMLKKLQKVYSVPNGLLLLTGPTGSGKTTTLYGVLSELNDPKMKIITVEDPVEYRLPRINQVQIQPKIELTFARVLRSVLRQDPDIIMVGELRDHETVEIALRAAMTGHLVLSTLHTNDAMSSAVRLIDMGAPSYLVATVLRTIIAQRLVRRLCLNCMEDHEPNPSELAWLKSVPHFMYEGQPFKSSVGCTYCHNTGYKGQIGVFELLEMTGPLIDALRKGDTTEFAHLVESDKDFKPLVLSGLDFALAGMTSVSEVIRIIGEIN